MDLVDFGGAAGAEEGRGGADKMFVEMRSSLIQKLARVCFVVLHFKSQLFKRID